MYYTHTSPLYGMHSSCCCYLFPPTHALRTAHILFTQDSNWLRNNVVAPVRTRLPCRFQAVARLCAPLSYIYNTMAMATATSIHIWLYPIRTRRRSNVKFSNILLSNGVAQRTIPVRILYSISMACCLDWHIRNAYAHTHAHTINYLILCIHFIMYCVVRIHIDRYTWK